VSNFNYVGPLGEIRAAHSPAGGTALSTTPAFVQLPDGTKHVFLTARNFTTAVVARVALNPYLIVVKTTDALVAAANATDYSVQAQDANAATTVNLSSMNTAAANNYLYVGSHLPFRGVNVLVSSANAVVSVLTVNYWNGTAWTTTGATDNSSSGGATLAVSGTVVWTVPTDWVKNSLVGINSPAVGTSVQRSTDALYWTRWQVSAQLTAATAASAMLAMARSTAYAELIANQTLETTITKTIGGTGCVEGATDAGTGSLIVNVSTNTIAAGFQ
jgi:hypothetical protein